MKVAPKTNHDASSTNNHEASPSAESAPVQLRGLGLSDQLSMLSPVQRRGGGGADSASVHAAAAQGTRGSGGSLPHLGAIQASFGHHDVSQVQAYQGGSASAGCEAMGAEAYATGNRVAFGKSPSLHTAAHEAAHVVQQRAGVSLSNGVGASGDRYEQHADRVADLVVQGKSAAGLLDNMTGGKEAGGGAAGVQRKDGDKNGLQTDAGLIENWAVAVGQINNQWGRLRAAQQSGVRIACGKLNKSDPPPLWKSLLKSAITIGLGAVTGGVGSVIVSKFTEKVGEFVINAAVEAGKGVVGKFVDAGANAAFDASPDDAVAAFQEAQFQAIEDIIGTQQAKTSVKMSELAGKGESTKWKGMQGIYDAMGNTRAYAKQKALDEAIFAWLRTLAQKEYGTVKDGDNKKTSAAGLRDNIDTSSVGTIGLRLKKMNSPSDKPAVDYCEIESSKGNNEHIRNHLLNSKLSLEQMSVPKAVLGMGFVPGYSGLGAGFNLAYNEKGDWASSTWSGGAISFNGGSDNAGKVFMAMYGLGVKTVPSQAEINANLGTGVNKLGNDLFGKTFKQLGITSIST